MKSFKAFIAETQEEKYDFHHSTTSDKIDTNSNDHIFLSHNAHQALGWHLNTQSDPKSKGAKMKTFKVQLKPGTNIAHHRDPHVDKLFRDHGMDQHNDYGSDLTSNPTSDEVRNHPGTKLLQKHGYHGYTHPDYDPHDDQKDHDATVLFNAKHILSATKVDKFTQ